MAVAAAPTTTIPGSAVGVIWFDITFRDREGIPDRISHTLTVAVPPGLPVPTSVTDSGAEAAVDTRPPVELGPPLPGPGWIVAGNCRDGAHRRSIQPVNGRLRLGRRFAVDWSGSDARHRPVVGDPDVNRNWVCYGAPVIAVADGTVAAAEDRFPDQIPNHPVPVTPAEADGNFVVLDLGDGRFAGFAHLVPGSVRVRPGDRVRRGQVIGNLGNSGSSSGPHLHFQVMDGPSLVDANGLPFVIDAFRVVGRIPPLDEALTASIDAGNPVPVGPVGRGPRHGELPLGRDVVDFRGPEDRHA
ncbi:M23 family metallopeptidase [Kitasatospora sp. NBC_00374]